MIFDTVVYKLIAKCLQIFLNEKGNIEVGILIVSYVILDLYDTRTGLEVEKLTLTQGRDRLT